MDILLNQDIDADEYDPEKDLFNHPKQQPSDVERVIDYYSEHFGGGGGSFTIERFLKDLNVVGYTFEYELDMEPYALRPLQSDPIKRPANNELMMFESGAWCALVTYGQGNNANKDIARQWAEVLNLSPDHILGERSSRVFSDAEWSLFQAGHWLVITKMVESDVSGAIAFAREQNLELENMHELEELQLVKHFGSIDKVVELFDPQAKPLSREAEIKKTVSNEFSYVVRELYDDLPEASEERRLFTAAIKEQIKAGNDDMANMFQEFVEVAISLSLVFDKAQDTYDVQFNGISYGTIDNTLSGHYTFYASKQDKLTGDHYIAIGGALNNLNKAD